MANCIKILSLTSLLIITVYVYKLVNIPTVELDQNQYWGPGVKPEIEDKTIREYQINIPDEVFSDLQIRLENTRPFHLPLQGVQHHYGTHTILLDDVLNFWKVKYNWKMRREPYFNQFEHYITNIQGLDIHYIHERPNQTLVNENRLKVIPILLIHGWPGSFREFLDVIYFLKRPREGVSFVFEVIVPSLPGFGFSQGASKSGLGASQIAVILNNLMKRIGFKKYYVQGGDWGSIIGAIMSSMYPDNVLGFHSNMCFTMELIPNLKMLLGSLYPPLMVEEKYRDRIYPLRDMYSWLLEETGYFHLQATKPDTIGVALTDSPMGLASYILEKFVTFTDRKLINKEYAGLRNSYSYESLLDNIMIYWVTGSITSSMRLYAETFNSAHFALGWLSQPVPVPSACARYKNEIVFQPESMLTHKYVELAYLKDYEAGGHFAAMELPAVFADDLWQAVYIMERY